VGRSARTQKLVGDLLADDHDACLPKPPYHRRIVVRRVACQQARAGSGRGIASHQHVFDPDRNSLQRSPRPPRVGLACGDQRGLHEDLNIGVHQRFSLVDPSECRVDEFDRTQLAFP
jgi:hypothetical protein